MRLWCSGIIEPSQGSGAGPIPARRIFECYSLKYKSLKIIPNKDDYDNRTFN